MYSAAGDGRQIMLKHVKNMFVQYDIYFTIAQKNGIIILLIFKEVIIMNEVYEFLKKCETYYLATVEGDQPRVRPFGSIDMFEDKLYILTGKVKDVSKQIQQNPKFEICACDNGKWLRVSGELVRDDRYEPKAHMLETYPALKAMYSADDDNTEVLYFKNATAVFSSFTEAPKTIKF